MTDHEERTFTLVQPSVRRREWELRKGEAVLARLWIPPLRSGARAEISGRELLIERRGRLRGEIVVTDGATAEEVARLRRDGRSRLLELDSRVAEWKRIDRRRGFGFLGEDGQPLLSARVRTSLLRSSGELHAFDLAEGDAVIASLLAAYLLIRRNEQAASGAAGAVVAAGA